MKKVIIANMDDELDRASVYAANYVRTHEKHIRSEYGPIVLAIKDGAGIVGFDKDLGKLVRDTTEISGAIVYGRANDFMMNQSLFRRVVK